MTDCKHDWHFVQGLTERLRCTRCGLMTWPKSVEERTQELLADVLTVGSAWSKGGERIDPASVFKDHETVHSCSYHCDRPECIKAQRDELRDRLAQPEQGPVAWRNAALRVGEDLCSVGPFGYYDMTAQQWLDWAMSQEPRGKNSMAQLEQKQTVPWESFFNRYCPWLEQPKQEKKT